MADIKLNYDTLTGGSFVEGDIVTWNTATEFGELVILRDFGDNTGEMYIALIGTSTTPADTDVLTVGGVTAATSGTPYTSRFPLNIKNDIEYNSTTGAITLNVGAPTLGTTHTFLYDGETGTDQFAAGDYIDLAGSGNYDAEIIAVADNGTDGELFVRMVTTNNAIDNATISVVNTALHANGVKDTEALVDGAVHIRAFTPNNIHYWFQDLGDDATFTGDDEQDRTKARVSKRIGVTDVELLGNATISDALSYRMYGGSISQADGTEYNAATIAVVDADGLTEPVLILNAVLLSATTTEYWKNGYMPNAASRINMLIKVSNAGAVIDRRVVRFRALELGSQYFTAPDPTLSGGITPISLVATADGNNTTDAATIAGWIDIVGTYGLQAIDHNNENGPQPYWMTIEMGAKSKTQTHEYFKWTQRRGTSETVHGLNAQLIVGNDLTISYDNEGNTVQFNEGETITFSGNSIGTALVLALDDGGTTGTLYCQRLTGDVPLDNANITGNTSGEVAIVAGTPIDRLIINNLVGTYTGSAFNPANIGITLNVDDADETDLFKDLLEVNQQPPTNRNGVVNTTTGDIITVYPTDGSVDAVGDTAPNFTRLTSSALYSGAAVTEIIVNETIPSWMPKSGGFIRATLVSGAVKLISATGWTGSTFTIESTDFSGDNLASAAGVMPAPIDQTSVGASTSFSGVYKINQDGDDVGDQQFVIKVTNGSNATPKQPNIGTAVFTSGGFSVNVNLQDD